MIPNATSPTPPPLRPKEKPRCLLRCTAALTNELSRKSCSELSVVFVWEGGEGEEVGMRVVVWECVKRDCVSCTISCDYILFDGVYPVGFARAENSMRGQDETSVQFFSSLLCGVFFLIRSERREQRECNQYLMKLWVFFGGGSWFKGGKRSA